MSISLPRLILALAFLPAGFLVARVLIPHSRSLRVLVVILSVIIPSVLIVTSRIWDTVAETVGINSGLDLLVYLFFIFTLTTAASILKKLRKLEHRLARVVQEIALVEHTKRSNGE